MHWFPLLTSKDSYGKRRENGCAKPILESLENRQSYVFLRKKIKLSFCD